MALVESMLERDYLAEHYPLRCDDAGKGVIGTSRSQFFDELESLVPGLERPLRPTVLPGTSTALDLLDFLAARASEPSNRDYHAYFQHHHLSFNRSRGLTNFRNRVEAIFARNGIAFTLDDSGLTQRLIPVAARPIVERLADPNTGDDYLDGLIEVALERFTSRRPSERQIALEKLWDALERTKDLALPGNTKGSIKAMLDKVAGEPSGLIRSALEDESKALTQLGNKLGIRHHAIAQEPVSDIRLVDWLFARCAAFIDLLLERG